jgi:hypothetical protein
VKSKTDKTWRVTMVQAEEFISLSATPLSVAWHQICWKGLLVPSCDAEGDEGDRAPAHFLPRARDSLRSIFRDGQ